MSKKLISKIQTKFHSVTHSASSTSHFHYHNASSSTDHSRHRSARAKDMPVQTERGIASFYIAIFATLIFGIITLSFIRIVVSEARQTSNSDLSRSAYDSALAGIEDGKIAVLKYHECISQGHSHADTGGSAPSDSADECTKIIYAMEKGIAEGSCDTVAKALGRTTYDADGNVNANHVGEVRIQESTRGADNGTSNLMQSYTCVKIAENLDDYRATLSSKNRTRLVPLRTENDGTFSTIHLDWFSKTNYEKQVNIGGTDSYSYKQNQINNGDVATFGSKALAPPPIAITFIQTDQYFSLNQLSVSNKDGNTYGTDVGRLTLVPKGNLTGNNFTTISAEAVAKSADKSANSPTPVKCRASGFEDEYACSVNITVPETFGHGDRNPSTSFLVVSLLYGAPITDFSITLCTSGNCSATDNTGEIASFAGVQTSIDSTGRANTLYRRVETRVDLYNTDFPYPEYAIQAEGNSGSITKNFYITKNCWYSNSTALSSSGSSNSGARCNNNGTVTK